MLKFILGRASSGKSYNTYRLIEKCVKDGQTPVLIIPEQFSFESEKRILSILGDKDTQRVKVLSFTRLCDEIEHLNGGAVKDISDADRVILMSRAIRSVRDKLKCFSSYSGSSGFSKIMLNTITEFRQNAVNCFDVFEAANQAEGTALGRKLMDTAYIYAEYEDLKTEKFLTSKERIDWLYDVLEHFKYFEGKSVFIDSFGGFTGQQYKIIDRILSQAKEVTVSLCMDNSDSGSKLFTNVKKAKERIKSMAVAHGVGIGEDIKVFAGDYISEGIKAVEEYMCFGKTDLKICNREVNVCNAQTAYDEALFAARNIRRIIREKNARMSDFVVIARNISDYEQPFLTACEKNEIKCFCDRRIPLNSMPPAVALKLAAELSGGITTEKILSFHKCGVGFLNEDELSILENYIYTWNIEGIAWQNNWNMDPQGLSGSNSKDITAELETVNELRIRAITPVNEFLDEFGKTTKQMASAMVKLLESVNAKSGFLSLSNDYKKYGYTSFCEGIKTSYAKVMRILDSIVRCLGESCDKSEFREVLKNCIDNETIGIIPQMVDEVTFGSAERIQPARPSYVFILGANRGVFPRAPQSNGVFSPGEIEKIINMGINIPDCSIGSSIDEDLLVYNCVCCADKQLYISFNNRAGETAHFVKRLIDNFDITVKFEPDKLSADNLPQTYGEAFMRFCRSRKYTCDYETVKSVLIDVTEYRQKIESVSGNYKRPHFDIPKELSRKLSGERIWISPSKLDTYSKCAFMYFCRYILGVKTAEPVCFSPMQSGTLLHYALQKFIEETKETLNSLSNEQIYDIIENKVNEYLDSFSGYRNAETPHLKYMVSGMTETLKYLGTRLRDEFLQSDFKPEACELVIGGEGGIPPLKLDVEDGIELFLTGIVDRLDKYGAFVRIIDYKSGNKDFKLPDILVGQNMQMLIYLYAMCKDGRFGDKPGGIFYMHAALPDDNTPKSRRMNGFMPQDSELINAMDKSGNGEFIPQSSGKTRAPTVSHEEMNEIFSFLEFKIKQAGKNIANGKFSAVPVDGREKKACEYCEFSSICRIEKEKPYKVPNLKPDEVMDEIRKQVSDNEV